jgi:hypothetical protein
MTQGANGWWLARKNRREAEEFAHAHRQVFLNLMVEYGGGGTLRRLSECSGTWGSRLSKTSMKRGGKLSSINSGP